MFTMIEEGQKLLFRVSVGIFSVDSLFFDDKGGCIHVVEGKSLVF
jgi:hypothetical protein